MEDEVLGCADVERERRRADAVEAHARAVGGDGKGFGAVATIDLGGVVSVSALEEVAAVAGVPDHPVVAGLTEVLVVAGPAGQNVVAVAAEEQVGAAFAVEGVIAGLAEQQIGARAAGERVIPGAPKQLGRGQRAVRLIKRDRVGAVEAEGLNRGGVCDRRRASDDRNG